MITSIQIQNLSNLRSKDHLISSLYLQLRSDQRIHQALTKDLIREKLEELGRGDQPPPVRKAVEEDLNKIRGFVDTIHESPHKGLVLFSSVAEDVWEVSFLPRPIRDLLVLDFSAYIRPLTSVLDQYRRVSTLLVDRKQARIFEFFMGEIEEQTEIFTDVPSKVREAGWYGLSERRIERHIQHHLQNHLKRVSERVLLHFRDKGFDWLFLGGQNEVLSQMENTLHSYLRKRLKKTFSVDLNSDAKEVLEKTLMLEREVKKEEDQSLVSRLAESLKANGLGVTGIHETLSALYEGSVHTLLVEEGFSQEGGYCPKCGFMGLFAGKCPICGEAMSTVPDIIGEAVSAAIHQNCEVVHITPGSGLNELGGIGALLRYKPALAAS